MVDLFYFTMAVLNILIFVFDKRITSLVTGIIFISCIFYNNANKKKR